MGAALPEPSAGVLLYRELLAAALGDDVLLLAPDRRDHDSGAHVPDDLIPLAWERRGVSVEPEACLAAVRAIVGEQAAATYFLLVPWMTWRELPAPARAEVGRLDLEEAVFLAAADLAAHGSRIASLFPMASAVGERYRDGACCE